MIALQQLKDIASISVDRYVTSATGKVSGGDSFSAVVAHILENVK